ncbi:hypothetical protein OEM_p200170 (plasmid) [Mycobacterium intracellulare subsp. yongonense 05-1390]|nr:hypothetical protein OEM_p200170 [Mycobacterium intracellulare subsp. yongonense 05-1390]
MLIHPATCPFCVHRSTITKILAYPGLRVHDNTQMMLPVYVAAFVVTLAQ